MTPFAPHTRMRARAHRNPKSVATSRAAQSSRLPPPPPPTTAAIIRTRHMLRVALTLESERGSAVCVGFGLTK